MYKENNKTKVPFCAFEGLNYSNVVDEDTGKISGEKFKSLKISQEPLAYKVELDFLTNQDFERKFNFKFGIKKSLIDWLPKQG